MGKIIWSLSALDDVDSIAEFIARDSVDRTSLFVFRLMESTDRLQQFPFSGRIIPEFDNKNHREIVYGTYRIMYKIEHNDVWITGIFHGG